jgi:hypothetical protein
MPSIALIVDAHWKGLQSPDRNHDRKPVAAPAVPSRSERAGWETLVS